MVLLIAAVNYGAKTEIHKQKTTSKSIKNIRNGRNFFEEFNKLVDFIIKNWKMGFQV